MVNIDTVYQRVLAFANKEQRGYITPQEFNLFANQAQMEIFEQYFYDLNQVQRIPGNNTIYADVDDILEQKIQIFEDTDLFIVINGYDQGAQNPFVKEIPDWIYRVNAIYSGVQGKLVNCEILNTKDFKAANGGTGLTKPNAMRPIANIRNNLLSCSDGGENMQGFFIPEEIVYIRRPRRVAWGYFVVGNKALYDPSGAKTMNFELHQSEETELVYKILKFAGVAMKRDDIANAGKGLEASQITQEKQ